MAIDRCVAQAASARAGGGGEGGGGAARPAGVGAPVDEVKKHRAAKGHSGVACIQNRTERHHIGYHITKGRQSHHTSL